jgi:hypothetical protein
MVTTSYNGRRAADERGWTDVAHGEQVSCSDACRHPAGIQSADDRRMVELSRGAEAEQALLRERGILAIVRPALGRRAPEQAATRREREESHECSAT